MHRHRYSHRKTKHDQIQLILQESVPLELHLPYFALFPLIMELTVLHQLMHFAGNYICLQCPLMVEKIDPYIE